MDDIDRMQYINFRQCFNDLLLNPILGDDYYNMAMDVYQCDLQCCKDIKHKYDSLQQNMKMYRTLFIIMFIISLLLILFK